MPASCRQAGEWAELGSFAKSYETGGAGSVEIGTRTEYPLVI